MEIGIVIGECQWFVGYLNFLVDGESHPLLWIPGPILVVNYYLYIEQKNMVWWNIRPKKLVAQLF